MQEYLNFRIDLNDERTVNAYDEVSLWSAMFGLLLLRLVPMRRNMRVLDAGCGTGFPLLELAQRLGPSCDVTGIDPWSAALDRAKAKMEIYGIKNCHLVLGDASSMPFENNEFDLIVSNLGLNNFENPDAVFSECHRVLKPEGRLSLTTNLLGHMKEFYEIFESTLLVDRKTREVQALKKDIEHRATVPKVESILKRHGFKMSDVHQETGVMRFVDGTSFLNHYFIQLGFLDAWKSVVEVSERERLFARLESNLNEAASRQNGLSLTIPMAYIEAIRVP